MKVFLTGASGFIGANITRALLEYGYDVRVYIPDEPRSLAGLEVEAIDGDIRDAAAVERAMAGCPVVIHSAALYELSGHPESAYLQVNVEGTRNVLTAARRLSVERIVYTSSVAAVRPNPDATPADESCFQTPEGAPGAYERSKVLAERVALAEAAAGGPVVILNPTTPFGPWDARPTPSGRIIVDFCRRRMPMYLDTGLNVVDVQDVAAAHVAAIERGMPGERYILGCANMTLLEILQALARLTHLPGPRLRAPFWAAYLAAILDDGLLRRLRGGPARIPLAGVREARRKMFVDSSKAVEVLGLPQTSPEVAFAKAINWFWEHGYIPSGPAA